MLLLSCSNLTRSFNEGPLFADLGFELYHGDRVGLVGPNGVGKTTLLKILAGTDQPDDGKVQLHAGARLDLLEQQPQFEPGQTLIAEARTGLTELLNAHDEMLRTADELAAATDENERKRLADRYERLNDLLQHHDAYNVDHHVEAVLDGLGFSEAEYYRPVETFSGGQQSRLMLAKLLLAAPDVLLLDEPSNHLDIDGTKWLEDYLSKQNEAMIIVSHDRYFLDHVVTKVFELHAGKLATYTGNYSAYVRQRHERYELQLKTWQAQREYIEKQEEYIRRVNYGELHKQAQSRQTALDRLERVEKPTRVAGPNMHFHSVRRSGDVVFEVEGISKAYNQPLFSDLNFQLLRGQRLGIIGPNGSGKTTLLRVLLGEEQPDSGKVRLGQQLEVGYYDQQLQSLEEDAQAIRAAWPEDDPSMVEQTMRDLLGRFGLKGDQVYQKVGSMSGGERSRVALTKLVARDFNLLVLDEPTNHLDLWARESLEDALKRFDGTTIVVSHDRYFLNQVVELLIVLGGGKAHIIHGNYDDYERQRSRFDAISLSGGRKPPETSRTPTSSTTLRRRKRKFPFRKVEDLEGEIHRLEAELQELQTLMASPDLYRDGDRVKQTTESFEAIKARLPQLYEHWEEAVELNPK